MLPPSSLDERFARAIALHQQGRLREAFDAYNAILAAAPTHAPSLHYSGLVLHQSGQSAAGLPRLERSVVLDPRAPDAWSNLALLYQALGRHQDAVTALDSATRLAPRDAALWENLAGTLLAASRPARAERAARRALQLQPQAPGAFYNLALALRAQRRFNEALQALEAALGLSPEAGALSGLKAEILEHQGRPDEARATLRGALDRSPRSVALRFQLASLCERNGDLRAAADAYQAAVDSGDPQGAALSQLLFVRKQLADWHDLDVLRERFKAGVAAKQPLLSPFCLLSDPSTRADQRRCAETWARGFGSGLASGTESAHGVGAGRRITPRDRLTIGYLSADFHMHATALLTAGLFERHDRKRYHVIGYSTGPDDQSTLRKRIVNAFERFVDARGWPAQKLAAQIAADGVDILVDLKGHTEHARTDVLALRPAPVQASYLGYPGTSGAPFIDYLLGDALVTPLAHRADYSETLVQLPACYQVNDRSRVISPAPAPQALGLPVGAVVLCCFNRPYKINPQVFDAWTAILRDCPQTVLWLLARSEDDPIIGNLRREGVARGIAAERLVFAASRPNDAYLGLYRHAALALDTWPYNGHTTTSDALWAGCPVLTLLGETFAGRVAASVLNAAGLRGLVAGDTDEYVRLATELVRDSGRLADLRSYLEGPGRSARLFDAERTTRAIERAFDAIAAQQASGCREPIVIADAAAIGA